MKTLHTAYRVTDLAVSLDFYSALGYQEVGRISLGDGATLTVLKFPGEEVVTLELVHRPADGPVQIGTGFSHLVVQVDELTGTIAALSQRALQPEPEQHPAGPDGPRTSARHRERDAARRRYGPTGLSPPSKPAPGASGTSRMAITCGEALAASPRHPSRHARQQAG